ncbi:alcohol dehydrogenase catalytic domain-containing protein [Amycolatopsis sp. CA-126428]|uniref:alcohol dehydrogenase catalytic domain-containing protein n=1 Tax=Amycolatopsis sp. CA-126428 TaxID=2073158 RepID=UPI001304890C|nr:alcohol dehydrogenase catalytic domain-containing protein [Amycolatopsis sp. CA-126428]
MSREGAPRRVVATGFGDESKLSFELVRDVPRGADDVVVRVAAIGVNPVDFKRYTDQAYASRRGDIHFPMPLGVEATGTVIEVGDDVVGPAGPIRVGDQVVMHRIDGAYGEQVTVAASSVLPKPGQVSWEQAACLLLAGTTAAHALAAVAARPGETVLVHAVSGSVGRAVAQLAHVDGIRVVGTTSGGHDDTLAAVGVTPIAYGPGLAERARQSAPDGYAAAIDLVGTDEAVDVSLELVADRRRIATVVAFDRAQRDGFLALGGSSGQDASGIAVRANARVRVLALAQAGLFHLDVVRFAFDDVRAAHELLGRGAHGHLVLTTDAITD